MLYDELHEILKNLEPDLQTIATFWQNSLLEKKYLELTSLTSREDFWQHPEQTKILKELQQIKTQRENYHQTTNGFNELKELVELFKDDEQELKKVFIDVKRLTKSVQSFKIALLLDKPEDASNCFFSINAGAGGTESQDWAEILLRMYIRFCEREKFNYHIVDYQAGEEAGIKSATIFIKGTNAYGLLKGEHGIHRLVRISPYDANKRRHTSFAGVHIVPEAPEVEININPQDLRIDTYRAGGAGGQHVNKTDSAVRITHLPTNIVVQCQNERSQLQNKETAMKLLTAKLYQKQQEEEQSRRASIEKKKIEWGSQIRSYVLHPYKMVKDHRTEAESPQPELILDGDLMEFIEKYLVSQGARS